MIRTFALLAVLLGSAVGLSAPPDVPPSLTVKEGKVKEFTVKGDKGKDFGFKLVGSPAAFREVIGDVPGERVFWLIPETGGASSIVWWTVGEKASVVTKINEVVVPPDPVPPPKPVPPPDPKPDPKPDPLTSFRVILVYESGDTETAAQRGILTGVVVETWLTANCTGGKTGWRRRDKDAPETDAPTAMLWVAVKPKLPTPFVPCVAIERNTKVEIIPLDKVDASGNYVLDKAGNRITMTPAEMVAVLATYRGK